VRVTGLFLAGVLASTTPMLAHAVSLGSDVEHLGAMRAAGFAKVWDGGGRAGIWYPVIGASGAGYGFHRIALPTVIPASGRPMVVGEVPTAVGNRLTGDGVLAAVGKAHTKARVVPAVADNPWQIRFEVPAVSAGASPFGIFSSPARRRRPTAPRRACLRPPHRARWRRR
jgi:hypothetical protein